MAPSIPSLLLTVQLGRDCVLIDHPDRTNNTTAAQQQQEAAPQNLKGWPCTASPAAWACSKWSHVRRSSPGVPCIPTAVSIQLHAMSKAGRPAGLRRAGQVLAAALLLTAVLLSQRGVQIAAPSVACERCSLATAGAAAAAATAAAVRHGQVASTARAGSGLASSQLSTANTEDGSSSSGSSSGGSSSSNSSGGGSSDGTDSATESATGVRGPAASSTCELAVEPSQWADSCILLRDACVDQGSIILYGPEHVMNGSSPGTAPYEIAPTPDYRKYIFLHRGSVSMWSGS